MNDKDIKTQDIKTQDIKTQDIKTKPIEVIEIKSVNFKQSEKPIEEKPVSLQSLPPVVIKEGRGKNKKEIIVPEDENIQKLYILLEEILKLYDK